MEYYRLNLKLDIDLKDYLADEAWLQRTSITALVNNILIDHMNKKTEHKEKPKLTDDEKAILRNISKRYEWIFAAQSDEVIISQDRPFKDETGAWRCDYYQNLYFLNRLFPFVKPEDKEPWHIPDLLED